TSGLSFAGTPVKQRLYTTGSNVNAAQSRLGLGRGMFFLLGMAFMGLVQALLPAFNPSAVSKPGELIANARIQNPAIVPTISSKPWGDFEYTKLPLEEPRSFLPNTLRPLGALRWFFAGS